MLMQAIVGGMRPTSTQASSGDGTSDCGESKCDSQGSEGVDDGGVADMPEPLLQLLHQCWHRDLQRRPTFSEISANSRMCWFILSLECERL